MTFKVKDGVQVGSTLVLDSNGYLTTRLATARTITLAGDVSGSASFDGSANISITATVADDSHTHDGRYYTESEADSRFVNVTGDSMTGSLLTTTSASSWGVYSKTSGVDNHSGIWFSSNVGELLLRNASGVLSTRIAADGSNKFINNNTIWTSGDGTISAVNDLRAPIFYDSNDTGYYADFNSTGTSINTAGSIRGTYYVASNYTSTGYTQYKGYDNNNHFIVIRGSVGGNTTSPTITGAHNTTLVEYAESNDSTGWFFKTAATGNYDIVSRITRSYSYFESSVRSPIFYDSNDTAYYIDPNGTSKINVITDANNNQFISGRHSGSDFPNGTLVRTNIVATGWAGDSFVLECTGKSYQTGEPPFSFMAQGYLYNDTIINYSGMSNGAGLSYIKFFQLDGYLCAWWPRFSYWNSFEVRVRDAGGSSTNRVTSITDSTLPAGTKMVQVDLKQSVMWNYNGGNTGALYGSILYDTNDTGYYLDPNSTSQFNLGRFKSPYYGGDSGVYSNDRMTLSVGNSGLGSIVYQSQYNSSSYPDYGMVFIHGASGGNRNVWSISPDGPARSDSLHFLYDLNSTNIHVGTTRFRLDGSGNSYSTASSRAPIFYDNNDTGFFCDPHGRSNLSQANFPSGLQFSGAFCLVNSGATLDNSTGMRMTESYGAVWNGSNGATWHHQVVNASSLVGFNASGGNFGNGNILASGNITAYYSDERLKTKISTIENALDKVKSLEGFIYVENELAKSLGYTNSGEQAGVSAQKVQAVLPQAVSLAPVDMQGVSETGEIISKSGENYLTVDYSRIVPLLIEAIKEQQTQIEELKALINSKL